MGSQVEGDDEEQRLLLAKSESFTSNLKVSVKGLNRSLKDGQMILRNCSFDVEEGQIICIMGPSGSGKSTLLRVLNRLWEPGKGCVYLDGKDITETDVISLRRRVGMLFQKSLLFEGTVVDNVGYGPSLQGKKLSEADVARLLHLANLDMSFATRHVSSMSGGQAQRVALARALANEPEVLLLDEPTSALDPAATRVIEESVLSLCSSNSGCSGGRMSVVWVTHSMEQVLRVADKVVMLLDGEVVDIFQPADLHNGQHDLAQRFAEGQLKSHDPQQQQQQQQQ